ncbi:hypothetical protein J2Y58_003127 [Sphingomonas sp. BE138]|uniref:hypothetical protein n=1 Tax=Sphingomonas sp. BE138 TaxID=2817845 RepID=UPI00286117FF|nr:hypothetical protein [Sphingomonas sp. BE138]MDR6789752.1 hypothetical protein [Sphingomonas sp. BE138]
MIGLFLLAAVQTASTDIVVSGQRLDEAFAQCEARRCTPLRDAQVSVAKDEQLIRDGRYLKAKRRLADAVAVAARIHSWPCSHSASGFTRSICERTGSRARIARQPART